MKTPRSNLYADYRSKVVRTCMDAGHRIMSKAYSDTISISFEYSYRWQQIEVRVYNRVEDKTQYRDTITHSRYEYFDVFTAHLQMFEDRLAEALADFILEEATEDGSK